MAMSFFEAMVDNEEYLKQDDHPDGAPTDVDTNVIARIEAVTLRLVTDLCAGKAPSLTMTSRAASNVSLQLASQTSQQQQAGIRGPSSQRRATQQDGTQTESQADTDLDQQPDQVIVAVGQRTQTRTMLQNQGAGAISIARSGYATHTKYGWKLNLCSRWLQILVAHVVRLQIRNISLPED